MSTLAEPVPRRHLADRVRYWLPAVFVFALGIAVWSLGTCPAGPQELRTRSAHALAAASLGRHVTVTRDDYVFADIDGVVVVAGAQLSRVISRAREIAAREQAQAERLLRGDRLRD